MKVKVPAKPKAKKPEDRVERWRVANPELYKERQREYQRAYRKRQTALKTLEAKQEKK